jgi:hypothetical protein
MLDYNPRLATLSFGYSLPNREMPTSFQVAPATLQGAPS